MMVVGQSASTKLICAHHSPACPLVPTITSQISNIILQPEADNPDLYKSLDKKMNANQGTY